jgi:hypothetical protein
MKEVNVISKEGSTRVNRIVKGGRQSYSTYKKEGCNLQSKRGVCQYMYCICMLTSLQGKSRDFWRNGTRKKIDSEIVKGIGK